MPPALPARAGKHGLACDNLLSAEVVTADGQLLTASAEENVDLFWGLRGGGGNFGVATSFELKLYRLPSVTAALLVWSPDRGPEILRGYRDFVEQAPDEVGGGLIYVTGDLSMTGSGWILGGVVARKVQFIGTGAKPIVRRDQRYLQRFSSISITET